MQNRTNKGFFQTLAMLSKCIALAAVLGMAETSWSSTITPSMGQTMNTDQAENNPASRGVITVDGAKLHYVIEGHGVTCLLIGSSIMYPRTFSQELRKHIKFVFLDGRHFVPTEGSFDIEKVTLDTYASDIEKARKTLALGKVFIIGHSIHGDLALEYARRYPQNVKGVIVIASPPVGLAEVTKASQAFWETDASTARKQQLKINWQKQGGLESVKNMPGGQGFIRTYVTNGPKYWYDAAYDCSWIWAGMDPNTPMTDRLFSLFQKYDLEQGPGMITSPVFLAVGRYDYVVPHALWDDQKQKLSHLSYHVFQHSGHTPQLEEPALFDRTLLEWIGTIH